MKRTAFFRILSFFFAVFTLIAGCGLITHAGTVQTAEEQLTSSPQSGNHFSPVYFSERLLTNRINKQRQAAALPVLETDWDLFRFARLSAEDLAAGRIRQVDVPKITRLFDHLGRPGGQIAALVYRAPLKERVSPVSGRLSDHEEQLIKRKTLKRIGAGHAIGKEGQVWVVLLSEGDY